MQKLKFLLVAIVILLVGCGTTKELTKDSTDNNSSPTIQKTQQIDITKIPADIQHSGSQSYYEATGGGYYVVGLECAEARATINLYESVTGNVLLTAVADEYGNFHLGNPSSRNTLNGSKIIYLSAQAPDKLESDKVEVTIPEVSNIVY